MGGENIPVPTRYPTYFLVNSSSTPQIPGHWLLLYLPSKLGCLEYFDSLCRPPEFYSDNIRDYIHVNSRGSYISNEHRVQSQNSFNCGLYAAYVIDKRLQGHTLAETLTNFDTVNLDYNDKLVTSYYNSHILADTLFGKIKS